MNLHLIDVIAIIFFLLGILFSLKKTLFEVLICLFQSITALILAFHFCHFTTFKVVESGLVKEYSLLPFSFLSLGFSVYMILAVCALLIKLIVEVKFISLLEHSFRYILNGLHFTVLFLFLCVFYLLFPTPFLNASLEENKSFCYTVATQYLSRGYALISPVLPVIEPNWSDENSWESYVASHYTQDDHEKDSSLKTLKSNLQSALSKITD